MPGLANELQRRQPDDSTLTSKPSMKNVRSSHAAALLALALPFAAVAADVFTVTATVDGRTAAASFKSADNVFDSLTNAGLNRINPGYTGIEAANVAIDFRGIGMSANYAVTNTKTLVFSIPSIGFTKSFTGATRDQSEQMLEDYLKANKDDILGRLFKQAAKDSPVDPIAGNPNSLMSRLVSQDFLNASQAFAAKGDEGAKDNLFRIGASAGSFSQGGIRSTAITVPISYIVRTDLDPRRQFGFHLPVTLVDTAGSKTYSLAPSVMYREPVTDNWALSPSVGVGVTGSSDLASLGSVWSASLTSSYVLSLGPRDLTIVNMVGRYQTLKIKSGDYSADPNIGNTVLKNGVILSQPVSFMDGRGSVEFSYANTQFFGSDLYVQRYNEYGVSIGTNPNARSVRSYFRAGINYLYSSKSKGLSANVGYWF